MLKGPLTMKELSTSEREDHEYLRAEPAKQEVGREAIVPLAVHVTIAAEGKGRWNYGV